MKPAAALLGVLVILATAATGQTAHSTGPGTPAVGANAWMKTPTDASSADDVPGMIRMDRDRVWDGLIGARYALTPEEALRYGIGEGASYAPVAEIPEFPNRRVLIGTFSRYRSILTFSTRAIYTEVTVDVTNVFEDASGEARAGWKITIIFPGGTVKTADGQIISYLTQPRAHFMQQGKTYLLVLGYHADGDSYAVNKDWDVSDGIVRADSALDRVRVKEGTSTLVGLTKDQLIRSLNERFSVKQ